MSHMFDSYIPGPKCILLKHYFKLSCLKQKNAVTYASPLNPFEMVHQNEVNNERTVL